MRKPTYFAGPNAKHGGNHETNHDGGRDRWLFSYADVITILLVLFAAIATRHPVHTSGDAAPDRAKQSVKAATPKAAPGTAVSENLPSRQEAAESVAANSASLQEQPQSQPQVSSQPQGPSKPQPLGELQPEVQRQPELVALSQALAKRGLELSFDSRGLVIRLPQAILFNSGDDHLRAPALPLIQQIALGLRDTPNKIQLVGHADAVPIHNRRFRDNWALSSARSLQLLEVLTKRYGIPASRLATLSYGSEAPKSSNLTREGRAENRRVEIVILNEPTLNQTILNQTTLNQTILNQTTLNQATLNQTTLNQATLNQTTLNDSTDPAPR